MYMYGDYILVLLIIIRNKMLKLWGKVHLI